MTLGNKLRSLRAVEGSLRGLGRPMTQFELAQAMKREVGRGLSQAYLSQIESGARPHITHTTRELLARFFRVYPGFLSWTIRTGTPRRCSPSFAWRTPRWTPGFTPESSSSRPIRSSVKHSGRLPRCRIRGTRFCCSRRFFARRAWRTGSARFCGPASKQLSSQTPARAAADIRHRRLRTSLQYGMVCVPIPARAP